MNTLDLNGVKLVFDDSGEPDLLPVLLLHGLSSARSTWARVTEALAGTYRVVALDQRGHNDSAHASGTYTLDHYVPDTIAFCEQVIGGPSVIVGHSLGGVIAAEIARRRPDLGRGLFLEDPPLFRGEESSATSPVAQMFPVVRAVTSEMRSRNAALEEYEAMIRSAPALNGRGGTLADVLGAEGTRAQAHAMANFDPEVFTPAIDGVLLASLQPEAPLTPPTILLRADPALGAAFTAEDEVRFLAANPDATVIVVEGASHMIHDEQPELFVAELTSVLKSI